MFLQEKLSHSQHVNKAIPPSSQSRNYKAPWPNASLMFVCHCKDSKQCCDDTELNCAHSNCDRPVQGIH